MLKTLTIQKWIIINAILLVALVLALFIFSFLGNPILPFSTLWNAADSLNADLFFHARLPRILLAAIVGAGLSSSGVTFQSLLRNPLADPYILGVSGGAALGGVLCLALGLSFHWVSLISFAFAMGSLFLIYFLAQTKGQLSPHTLLLTGVIFNAFAFALILFINSIVHMGQAHQIMYLLIGSLEAHSYQEIIWVGVLTLVGLGILFSQSSKMNLVSLGEETSSQLGVSVDGLRKLLFVAASLIVGASVSIAGLIGFVGLFVPHMMRLMVGPDHRLLLPASALGGGIFLILCDFVAKTLFSAQSLQTSLPVGVITALIGGPFFACLLKRSRTS